LHPFKNIPLLLDAFAEYRRQGGHRNLEIVGQGPLEHELKCVADGSNIRGFITFSGYQTYESLPECYARARCLILPSLSEPWGLVVNEAMASGLPVIVSDRCGCADELVENGRNGFVFPAQSVDELTKRMFEVDALNDEEWGAMARRSQEISARFSPETWADAVLRLVQGQARCSTAA
jgi:glycosyltransferase involved in cell wall biosynthesis